MKAAVIGTGRIARQHLGCLAEIPGVEIAAVCDLWPGLAEASAERYRVPRWFTDHRKMLDEIRPDTVHVTTPPNSHFRLAMDSLDAGAHVIVEKPITASYDELAALQKSSAAHGKMLLEDYNYLFNSSVREIVRLRDNGQLGEVTHVEVLICLDILGKGSVFNDPNAPHPCLSMPGGAIADFLTHLASLACLFIGPHVSVSTLWSKRKASSPLPSDEFRALIRSRDATATLGFSDQAQPDMFCLRVHGTKMRAETNLFEPGLIINRLRGGPKPLMPLFNGLDESRETRRRAIGGLWRKLSGGPGAYDGLWELLGQTYASLKAGAPPPLLPAFIDDVNKLVADLTKKEFEL
jgi:predicted dehydrogenase